MRTLILIALASTLAGCPQEKSTALPPPPPPAPPEAPSTPEGLVLVEAELATRMQNGRLQDDEFCESEVPLLHLRGSTLEMQCGQDGERWTVVEEKTEGARRVLKTEEGKRVVLEEKGRQRYQVTGSYCDRAPAFYVVYPEAKSFRDSWLSGAACPTEDMKLAP